MFYDRVNHLSWQVWLNTFTRKSDIWSVLIFYHEGNLWRGHVAVVYFILTKQIFLHFYPHGDRFYKRYINKKKKYYLDDDGTGVKPKNS